MMMDVQIEQSQGVFLAPPLTVPSVPVYPIKPISRGKPRLLTRPKVRRKPTAAVVRAKQEIKQEFKEEFDDDDDDEFQEAVEDPLKLVVEEEDVLQILALTEKNTVEEETRLFPVEQLSEGGTCRHLEHFKEHQRGAKKYRKMLRMIFGLPSRGKPFHAAAENKVRFLFTYFCALVKFSLLIEHCFFNQVAIFFCHHRECYQTYELLSRIHICMECKVCACFENHHAEEHFYENDTHNLGTIFCCPKF